MIHAGATIAAFLLVFPALFSIVNPFGGALIFNEAAGDRTLAQRAVLARRIGVYSLAIILGALWGGSYLLNFFGITIAALRIAGGLVVAIRAWALLTAPEHHEERKQKQAEPASENEDEDVAFYPLTMPFTTGPGTISVAVTLGSERPTHGTELLYFFIGASGAAAALAIVIWLAYRFAGGIVSLLGPSGSRIVTRLMAFILLCIGVQIMLTGATETLESFLPKS